MRFFRAQSFTTWAVVLLTPLGLAAQQDHKTTPRLDVAFVENRGQWDNSAQYMAQMPGLNMWVTSEGLVYDFHEFRPEGHQQVQSLGRFHKPIKGTTIGDVVKMSFVGANGSYASGSQALPGKFNFLRKNASYVGVNRFAEVRSQEVYKGVDARYYFDHGMPRYDLIVHPGADSSQIKMKLEGAQDVSMLPNGNLRIQTPMGPVEEQGLTVYQGEGKDRRIIPSKMQLDGNTVGFSLGSYDSTKPVVIDPVLFSTYIGGSGGTGDAVTAVTYDTQSVSIFAAGNATSPNFPVTIGTYQNSFYATAGVGFLASFANSGGLNWCTFVEGVPSATDGYATVTSVVGDGNGNAFVAGDCYHLNLPTTSSAYLKTDPGNSSGFAFRLNGSGNQLLSCTYVGGNGDTYVSGLAISQFGSYELYLVGETSATNLPTKSVSFQKTNTAGNGGASEGFILGLAGDLFEVYDCTYLGGTQGQGVTAITMDPQNDLWVTGYTNSSDFPITENCLQPHTSTTRHTAFASCLKNDFTGLLASTYLGGTTSDTPSAISYDPVYNCVAIGGYTVSSDFPVTAGALEKTYPGHATGFASIISPDATTLQTSTYFGATGASDTDGEAITDLQFDKDGAVVVCGYTYNADFPTTYGAYQKTAPSLQAAFLAHLNADLSGIFYSTLFGANDSALSLMIDPSATFLSVFLGGSAGEVPTTFGAYQSANSGGTNTNGFLAELQLGEETLKSWVSEPGPIEGGFNDPMAVYLSSVAPPWGAKVLLSSNSPEIKVPSSILIPSGKMEGDFFALTGAVSAPNTITVTATYQGLSTFQKILVVPYPASSVKTALASVVGGNATTGTVTLAGPAGPTGSVLVHLSSNNAAVQVPATVSVPANLKSVAFGVKTTAVSVGKTCTIEAYVDSAAKVSTTLDVVPVGLGICTLAAPSVVGGNPGSCTIHLNAEAGPTALTVLTSSNNAVATVPTSVVVPTGASSAVFAIPTTGVDTATVAHITLKMGTAVQTLALTVEPAGLKSVFARLVYGGLVDTGTVYLNGKTGSLGTVVTLLSSSPLAAVPASVKVLAGQSSVPFTFPTGGVNADTVVHLTAKLGTASVVYAVTLEPAILYLSTLAPASVKGGVSSNATVKLLGKAGAAGVVVKIASDSVDAVVPASVTIPASLSAGSFVVKTKAVTATTTAHIKLTLPTGSTETLTLTITP